MKFDKILFGYNPKQVNKYIEETANSEAQLRIAQKERIDQLSDENFALRQQLERYQQDEEAISKSLVESQRLAQEMSGDAQKFSDLVLDRAKMFYATWRAYSQTLVAGLSPEEVKAFADLQRRLENLINSYEGKDVQSDFQVVNVYTQAKAEISATSGAQAVSGDKTLHFDSKKKTVTAERKSSKKSADKYANPIDKVEEASGHVIELSELTSTDESLEDLCIELGLISKKPD